MNTKEFQQKKQDYIHAIETECLMFNEFMNENGEEIYTLTFQPSLVTLPKTSIEIRHIPIKEV